MIIKLEIERALVGTAEYFRSGKPYCLIGHALSQLGETRKPYHLDRSIPKPLHFLLETPEKERITGRPYSDAWFTITYANDSGQIDDAIKVFAANGIEIELV